MAVFVNFKKERQGKVARGPCFPLGHVPRERRVMVADAVENIDPQAHSRKQHP